MQLLYEWRRDFAFQRGACGTAHLARLQLADCRLHTLPHWVRVLGLGQVSNPIADQQKFVSRLCTEGGCNG